MVRVLGWTCIPAKCLIKLLYNKSWAGRHETAVRIVQRRVEQGAHRGMYGIFSQDWHIKELEPQNCSLKLMLLASWTFSFLFCIIINKTVIARCRIMTPSGFGLICLHSGWLVDESGCWFHLLARLLQRRQPPRLINHYTMWAQWLFISSS